MDKPTPLMVKAAASALAKAAAERSRGPMVSRDLEFLPYDRCKQLMEDAELALEAALAVAPWAEAAVQNVEE